MIHTALDDAVPLPMLPDTRQLVHDSWALARPAADELSQAFYARLFEIDPNAARLFGETDMNTQRRKFCDMLDTIVAAVELDDPARLVTASAALARRHAGYGVLAAHYDSVGEALLWALANTLGGAWTDDVRAAWREAFALLASMMRRVTDFAQPRRLTMPLLLFIATGFMLAGPVACAHPAGTNETREATPRVIAAETALPVRYDEHRWIARPVTDAGDTLDLYTDSGGGFLFIARERLGANAALTFAERTPAGDSMFTASWPSFRAGHGIPAPRYLTPPNITTASRATFRRQAGALPARDGFLGNAWFAGRVWTFDYPDRRLLVRDADPSPTPLGGATVPLGFKNGPVGGDSPWFARLRVAVDGDSLDLLFDTGASTVLTDSARAAVGDGRPASRAASFITRTVFDGWRRRHPKWRVIARAEAGSGADMIEVSALSVAGFSVGPVWFTARPDRAFAEYMSQWMDRTVVGALGGSALHYFRVTVDYPNRRATFARAADGKD